jgi:tRNA(fMet)-specific endonuclease VapC
LKYLLDTNICIATINRLNEHVAHKLLDHHAEDVVTSVVCAAELRFGAEKSKRRAEAMRRLDVFLRAVRALPLEVTVLEAYGHVRADLARRGKPIGPLDTFIAAHALSLGLILVTNNTRELRRVPGLVVEDWSKAVHAP